MYWDGDINNALKLDDSSRTNHQNEVDLDFDRPESFSQFVTQWSMDISGRVSNIYDAKEYWCVYLEKVFIVDEGTKVLRFECGAAIHYPKSSPLPCKPDGMYSFTGRISSADFSWNHMNPRHIYAPYGFMNGVDFLCLDIVLKDATCISASGSVYTGRSFGLSGGERFSHRPSTNTSQLENEIQLLERYEKEYENNLHEPEKAGPARQRYSKQIELVRSQFPEEHAWRFHEANLYHHTAVQKYADEKVREAFEWIDKAISTDDRARHRMVKAKLCHKSGQRETAIAELEHICAKWPDSNLYLDARQLKDKIQSEPKGSCFIATAAYGSAVASEVVLLSRFRDEVLLPSRLGALFVTFYYQVSPPLASLIGRVEFLRAATRGLFLVPLLRFVRTLARKTL
jgi:tetratricopeptide (TPR) repeat protein